MDNQTIKRIQHWHNKNFSVAEIASKINITQIQVKQVLYGEMKWHEYKDKEIEKAKAKLAYQNAKKEKAREKFNEYRRKLMARYRSEPHYNLTKRLKKIGATCTAQEFMDYMGNPPICYLTGRKIDYFNPSTFHIEHKMPVSRGGSSDLSNLAIAWPFGNLAKATLTTNEFIAFCREVVNYQDNKSIQSKTFHDGNPEVRETKLWEEEIVG